jgi:hypothetical protein
MVAGKKTIHFTPRDWVAASRKSLPVFTEQNQYHPAGSVLPGYNSVDRNL